MNYTGFWRRWGAAFIDAIILIIPSALIGGTGSIIFGFGSSFIIGFLYFPFFESSELQGTPGKALLGMIVTSEGGDRISFKAGVIRFLCSYLSTFILFMGYIMQIFTTKRQTLHDMISETIVVDREMPDLNYFKVWKEKFKEIVNQL
jgi:uncharacterized RDD family membrane protein YckC